MEPVENVVSVMDWATAIIFTTIIPLRTSTQQERPVGGVWGKVVFLKESVQSVLELEL